MIEEGHGMQGRRKEDHMMTIEKVHDGCGEQDGKKADRPKEGEGTSQGKLGGMGMMGGWIEVGTHLNKGEKLTSRSPLGAYWDDWDSWDAR
jgi:hypothetical protein